MQIPCDESVGAAFMATQKIAGIFGLGKLPYTKLLQIIAQVLNTQPQFFLF